MTRVVAPVHDFEGVGIVIEPLDLFLGGAIVELLVGAPVVTPGKTMPKWKKFRAQFVFVVEKLL